MKCLLSTVSEKYLNDHNKKNIQPDLKNIQGMTAEDILMTFYEKIIFKRDKFGWSSNLDLSFYKGKVINYDLLEASKGKIVLPKKEQK